MAKRTNKDGYYIAKLSKNGKEKNIAIHILVVKAFIENDDIDKNEVNHIDFNRTNNHFNNLEWITHRDNVHYSIAAKRHVCTKDLTGKNNPNYDGKVLHNRYKNNPELAKKILSRPGAQNGRSKKVIMIDSHDKKIEFSYIGECCQYLIDNKYSISKIESLRSMIRIKVLNGASYKGFRFKYK